jgi:Zn2+/Cd2+-exporting ATPase
VETLLSAGKRGSLVFVGDRTNDSPVHARADVGVAMGALGSDAAVEAADFVLMDDDPRRLSLAVQITRRMHKIARKSIVFSLVVKAAVLARAGVVLANMWMAMFADVRVSMIAILNATRTLQTKSIIPISLLSERQAFR